MKLPTAGLLIIENRKLLLAYSRNKQCFYLPGGKIDTGETVAKALCREIAEEMNVTISEHELNFYIHISAPPMVKRMELLWSRIVSCLIAILLRRPQRKLIS